MPETCEQQGSEVGGKSVLLLQGNQNCGAVSFEADSDTFTLAGHSLENGEKVKLNSIVFDSSGTVPADDTEYYVINSLPASDTFQLSATEGGSTIDIDDDGDAELEESFKAMAGIRTKSFTLNSELIDITNQDTEEWRKILDEAGIQNMALSGSGVFSDALTIRRARTRALSQKIHNYRFVMNKDGDYFEGFFKVTALTQNDEYNSESTYDVTLESSGKITFNEAS